MSRLISLCLRLCTSRLWTVCAVLCAWGWMWGLASDAKGQDPVDVPRGGDWVQGEWIVRMERRVGLAESKGWMAEHVNVGDWTCLSQGGNMWLLVSDDPPSKVSAGLAALRDRGRVHTFQKNHWVEERQWPNDPLASSQWHHAQVDDHDVDSEVAWSVTTGGVTAAGDRIVVAVLEGGGALTGHPDLVGNRWTNAFEIPGNGVDDDGNGYVDDVHGWNASTQTGALSGGAHGTAVCGMVGGQGNNGQGGSGINWDVDIMVVQMGSLTEANVLAAYDYPFTMRQAYNATSGASGAFVVATNASWGIDNADPAEYPVWCSFFDDMGSAGMLSVAATTNNDINVDWFGDMPTGCNSEYLISVTSTNAEDARSGTGYSATAVDLGAPGEAVVLPAVTGGYGVFSGTSYASPCVAGAVGLLYSVPCEELALEALGNPAEAAGMVRDWVFGGVDVVPTLQNVTTTGGRLNVGNSVLMAMEACGCLDVAACNFQPEAALNSGACLYDDICGECGGDGTSCSGCTDPTACNFDPASTVDNGTCEYDACTGCTDAEACNFNPSATVDDGSCVVGFSGQLTLGAGDWGEAFGWQLVDALGVVWLEGQGSGAWDVCVPEGCYQWRMTDEDGDGWNGATYELVNAEGQPVAWGSLDDAAFGDGLTDGWDAWTLGGATCTWGCLQQDACNYAEGATLDDGLCVFPHPVYGCPSCDVVVELPAISLSQGGASEPVVVSAQGAVDTLHVWMEWTNPEGSTMYASDLRVEVGLPDGTCQYFGGDTSVPSACASVGNASAVWPASWGVPNSGWYEASIPVSSWSWEGAGDWTISWVNGYPNSEPPLPGAVTLSSGFGLSGLCDMLPVVPGCTDPEACNFDPDATSSTPSCEYPAWGAYVDGDGDGVGTGAWLTGFCLPLPEGFAA